MKLVSIQHKTVRLFCFLGLVALALLQFRLVLFEQSEYSQKADLSSLHKYQRNPYLLSWLAKQKHVFDADLSTANSLYQKALKANPVYLPAWLGLAELKLDQHLSQQANAILDYTSLLAKDIKRWRWDKALVANQADRKDILAKDLSFIISEIGGKQKNDALRMAFSVWQDPSELLEILGDENLVSLFRYATSKKKVDEGLVFFQALEIEGIHERKKDVLSFINMLLSMGEVETANTIWDKLLHPNSLFFNGNFSKELLQTAFSWRIGKNKGANWKLTQADDKGEPSSLHLHFNRKNNINLYNIYQIVPLQGGKVYALKGEIKTANLSTDQLPFLEAYGYKCKAPNNKTEMVKSDQPWTNLYLLLEVPEECNAMVIRLRRRKSTYIDNKLAGDIWLANFEIAETGEHFTILDEQ